MNKKNVLRLMLSDILLKWLTPLLVCLAVFSTIDAAAKPTENDFTAVDTYIEKQIKDLHIPGLALAIVQGDHAAYVQGYGKAGPGKVPITPQTSFMIGSITKSFTALAIMQLVEAGKINLGAPVQAYLPWFRVADEQASAQITIRHLLNQSSGFSGSAGLTEEVAHDLSDTAIEDSVRRLAEVELARTPGAAYEYSNVNFTILGQVIQAVSGQSYEAYVQEHIFDPLEMHHSFTSQDEALQNGMATGYLSWFSLRLPRNLPFNRGNLPNGFLICSAEDMSHYLIAQLNDGRYGSVNVLSAEGIAAMYQGAMPTKESESYYGMAWYIGEVNGAPALYHSGDNPNFQTHLLMFPQEKLGIAVMINVNGLPVNNRTRQIARDIAALLHGEQPQPRVVSAAEKARLTQMVGSVVVPVTLSLVWIAWTVYRFLRRRKGGIPARRSLWWTFWVIALPVVVDASLLLVLLVGIPTLWGTPLGVIAVFFADMFSLLVFAAVALGAWGLARTLFTLKQARSQPKAAL